MRRELHTSKEAGSLKICTFQIYSSNPGASLIPEHASSAIVERAASETLPSDTTLRQLPSALVLSESFSGSLTCPLWTRQLLICVTKLVDLAEIYPDVVFFLWGYPPMETRAILLWRVLILMELQWGQFQIILMMEKGFEENGNKYCIIKNSTWPNVCTHECHWPLQISGTKQIRLQYSKEKGASLMHQQAACITDRLLERER